MARTMSAKTAEFKLYAPQAKKVSVAGSFNKWDAKKLTAKKDTRGSWTAKTGLKPGRYEYKFIVDGKWINDPNCSWTVQNSLGSQNCVFEVR